MKKKIYILIGAVGWALLIVFISYSFGWKAWKAYKRKMYLKGVNDAVAQVINEAQQKGKVIINTQNGQLVLVPKAQIPEQKAEVKE